MGRRVSDDLLERELEGHFRRGVKSLHGTVHKLVGTKRGMPDRLVLLPGGIIRLVELKRKNGKLSALQEDWITKADQLGVYVAVLYGRAEIDAWIREQRRVIGLEETDAAT